MKKHYFRDDVLQKAKLARKLPVIDLLSIFKKNLALNVRKVYIKSFPVALSTSKFLELSNYDNLDEFIDRKLPPFLFNYNDKNKIISFIKGNFPDLITETVKDADNICNHNFNLLGSGKVNLGNEINWHSDFKSGFMWNPQEYYINTSKHMYYFIGGINADVIVPWELSRCQHFVTLGKAYWYTQNEKYAKEFRDQIGHWIENNPIELGVNWVSTMDVSIRAVNWIWGYYFFHNSKNLSKEFKIKFAKNLFLHGRHITNNLEYRAYNNHYLSCMVSLTYLGIFFRESEDGKKWLEKGINALKEEMKSQVYPDGVDFEVAMCYHRLVTELFISATVLCNKNGIEFPEWFMNRLEKMIEFISYYTKPDGSAPLIGDNDDGRLHILSSYGNWDNNDHRYLASVVACLFNRPDLIINFDFDEEAFWLLGGDIEKLSKLSKFKRKLGSKSFEDSGFYIIRHDDLHMILDCVSPDPNAFQGHKHNSALNFELFAYDKSFIVDPGSYVYTADKYMRNLFRSTKYHNVVEVDGEEQNYYNKNEIFNMGDDAEVHVSEFKITDQYDYIDAEHHGYKRIDNPIIHQREVFFDKNDGFWVIKDSLKGEGKHSFDLNFHFAPMELEFYKKEDHIAKTNVNGANMIIIPLETDMLSSEIVEGWVSYEYGKKIEAPILKYSKYTTAPSAFLTLIYPFKEKKEITNIIEYVNSNLKLRELMKI